MGARAVPRRTPTCWRWPAGCTGSRTRPTAGWPGFGAELFESGTRALTHCNTGALATGGYGTACGVLRAAWDSGRLAEVWVDETRPLLQGARLTAWELRQAGIPHRVVADSAAGSLMARGLVDRVVVGADRIAANGDVANKVGTYPLAVLAARHGVPFYVAAPLSTIDPATPDGGAIPIEERDPSEVLAVGDAFNPAFDVTPAELVTAIVTEAGVLEAPYPESIARAVGAARDRRRRAAVPLAGARWCWGSAEAATWWARSPPPRRAALHGAEPVVGGVTWERRPIDPQPGPRAESEIEGGRRLAPGVLAASAGTRVRESGVIFAESRMAELLGEETVLVDATLGPAQLADGIAAAAASLGVDLVVFVDVGGDALAHGDEPGLASPLCDALLLAAAARLAERGGSRPCSAASSASAATASSPRPRSSSGSPRSAPPAGWPALAGSRPRSRSGSRRR